MKERAEIEKASRKTFSSGRHHIDTLFTRQQPELAALTGVYACLWLEQSAMGILLPNMDSRTRMSMLGCIVAISSLKAVVLGTLAFDAFGTFRSAAGLRVSHT